MSIPFLSLAGAFSGHRNTAYILFSLIGQRGFEREIKKERKKSKRFTVSSRAIFPKVIPSGPKSKGLDKQFLPLSWEKCTADWFCNLLIKDCGNSEIWNVVKMESMKGNSFIHSFVHSCKLLLRTYYVLYFVLCNKKAKSETDFAKFMLNWKTPMHKQGSNNTPWQGCTRNTNGVLLVQQEWTARFDYGTWNVFNRKTRDGSWRMSGDYKVTGKMMGEKRNTPSYSIGLVLGWHLGTVHNEI